MVTGWRRAFCTSIPKEREPSSSTTEKQQQQQQQQQQCSSNNPPPHSPRISSKFGFFSSNPSTPRLPSHLQQPPPISTPSLRCKTTTTTPTSSLPNSPRLQCKTPPPLKKPSHSPRFFHFSNTNDSSSTPSSPKSPAASAFSLLKSTLGLSKQQSSSSGRCGICIQGVKSGEGTAIFTAECNHVFHFPCVTALLKKNPSLSCPVCSTKWKQLPLLSIHHCVSDSSDSPTLKFDINNNNFIKSSNNNNKLRVYNDDEPLMSPFSIPELEENDAAEEEEDLQEFQGFFVTTPPSVGSKKALADVTVSMAPESAVVAMGRGFETRVVVVKVRAPPCVASRGNARRAPIDLVAVVDVSERMGGVKSQVMKRAMRLVVSSLTSADRLSVVAFSGSSKRLFPLRRMTVDGRRSARRLVDALASGTGTAAASGQGMMSVNDALKKAAKVIEDRREKNHVATIMILSNGHDERSDRSSSHNRSRLPLLVSSTRFFHLETPVHSIGFGEVNAYNHAPFEDAFAKCLRGLLSVVVQDVNLQVGFVSGSAEISAVYSLANRPGVFGPGSIRVGDLHAEEEREFLVELKVPVSSSGSHHNVMSVRSSCRDASSQELIVGKERGLLLPKSQPVRSPPTSILRLRNLHVTTRAVAESRRLMEHGDLSGAHHLLLVARAMLMKSTESGSPGEYLRGLEAELTELSRRGLVSTGNNRHRRSSNELVKEKPEPLTPTSAWRAAERLAKVAITRKQMNRVSDLHGFENARF